MIINFFCITLLCRDATESEDNSIIYGIILLAEFYLNIQILAIFSKIGHFLDLPLSVIFSPTILLMFTAAAMGAVCSLFFIGKLFVGKFTRRKVVELAIILAVSLYSFFNLVSLVCFLGVFFIFEEAEIPEEVMKSLPMAGFCFNLIATFVLVLASKPAFIWYDKNLSMILPEISELEEEKKKGGDLGGKKKKLKVKYPLFLKKSKDNMFQRAVKEDFEEEKSSI